MANGEEKGGDDFYAVLGLKKECTGSELRKAYKKLALVRVFNHFCSIEPFVFLQFIQMGPLKIEIQS